MLPPRRPNTNRVGLEIFVYAVLFAAIIILLMSCSIPDDVRLEYGHEFRNDSSVGIDPSFPFAEGDSDFVGVSFGWRLKPMEVYPLELPETAPIIGSVAPHSRDVDNGVKAFDALDWVTKVVALILVSWFLWVYRKLIGAFLGRFLGKNGV